MPALAPTALTPRALGAAALAPRALGAGDEPSVLTLAELPPASVFAAGPEVAHYWAARSGRAGSNYSGAYLLLGSSGYVYWTHGGQGHDPGLDVLELAGLDGHVVALPAGNRTGAQNATATAAVIDALAGWACTSDGAELEIVGPEAVTTGETWDDATTGEMVGMRVSGVGFAGYAQGGINSAAVAQHLPNPGLDLPILAVDVLLGATVNAADRFRVALWTAAGSTSPAGETLLLDLGRLPADQIVANRWARVYVPAGTNLRANVAMWASLKGALNQTDVGVYLSGSALIGDWTAQNMVISDQGEPSAINPDATVAWPATWTGATATQNAVVCGIRLVVAGTVGDASHHSAADPAIWGTHAPVGDLGSSIDLESHLFMVADSPPFLGMLVQDIGWAVGAARGTQPRLGMFTGSGSTDPDAPVVDGMTVLVDAGRLTGSSTTAWENRSASSTPWPASTPTAWAGKCDDDTTGTNIAFAQGEDRGNANPPETPMDWLVAESAPAAAQGSEVEIFPLESDYDTVDPAVAFETPIAEPTPQRPRNVPGARVRWRIRGITLAS